jgi:cytochrome c biogenesis protein CcmG/thiol:disulfide interchange protein DsbE
MTTKRPSTVAIVAAMIALLVLAFVIIAARAKPADQAIPPAPLSGKEAPPIRAINELNGQPFSLTNYGDGTNFVVVNFFTDWCTTCDSEHDELIAFGANPGTNVPTKIMQVMRDNSTSKQAGLDYLNRRGIVGPTVWDEGGRIALAYGVRGQPESFVIDPGGIIIGRFVGPVTSAQLSSAINAYIASVSAA